MLEAALSEGASLLRQMAIISEIMLAFQPLTTFLTDISIKKEHFLCTKPSAVLLFLQNNSNCKIMIEMLKKFPLGSWVQLLQSVIFEKVLYGASLHGVSAVSN